MERYVWGRSYAAVRVEGVSAAKRAVFAVLCPVLPFVLLLATAAESDEHETKPGGILVKALPLTFLLDVAWSYGEFVGYVTGHP